MKKLILLLFFIPLLSYSQNVSQTDVKNIMKKVADWQIENHGDVKFRAQNPMLKKTSHHPLDWTNGALYTGMVKWAAISSDDKYYNWLKEIAGTHQYSLHKRKYHADDHIVGQLYVELYRKFKDTKMLDPTIEQFNFIMLHPSLSILDWKTPYHQDRWNWCDALFMSPPVWAMLYNITKEKKYLDFMIKEFKATTDFLFDKKENLYYRDQSYIGKLDNGTKIFWSRGNGWVFAGLVNLMNELDPQTKEYQYFLKIYKKMAKKLLDIQTTEGHWSMSLLGQEFYPTPETSGSSFYTFGLAWGVNKGVLDKETYLNATLRGWKAMVSHVNKEGMLAYVQPIGGGPGQAFPDKTEVYGVGAFLSAGSQIYHLVK